MHLLWLELIAGLLLELQDDFDAGTGELSGEGERQLLMDLPQLKGFLRCLCSCCCCNFN